MYYHKVEKLGNLNTLSVCVMSHMRELNELASWISRLKSNVPEGLERKKGIFESQGGSKEFVGNLGKEKTEDLCWGPIQSSLGWAHLTNKIPGRVRNGEGKKTDPQNRNIDRSLILVNLLLLASVLLLVVLRGYHILNNSQKSGCSMILSTERASE